MLDPESETTCVEDTHDSENNNLHVLGYATSLVNSVVTATAPPPVTAEFPTKRVPKISPESDCQKMAPPAPATALLRLND